MKWFRTVLILFLGLSSLFITSCEKESKNSKFDDLRFLSEEYKPINYTENFWAKGLAPELLDAISRDLGFECDVEFLPWTTAYQTALNTNNTVLFSTTLNQSRKDLFKWAGPILSLDWMFFSSAQSVITISDIAGAKGVGKIGVIANYAIEQYLKQEGFTNLVYCTDVNDAVNKLLNGQIDLYPSDKLTIESALETLGQSPYAVTSKMVIKTEMLYFAFNKNTPDDIVSEFQEAIDRTKRNGILAGLTKKYLHKTDYPDIVQVYTENYPPLTFRNNDGEITGFGTDVVKEIMKRNSEFYNINLSSWSNGYQLALSIPNFCLFTMDKTSIRENLFKWVGPIGTNTTWIYTKAGSGITITSLENAKSLPSIGCVNSWFSTQYLQQQGFANLVYDSNPSVLADKLMKGQISAFVCTDITFPDILKQLGYSSTGVTKSFSVMSSDFYIAFSKSTSDAVVSRWQSALNQMKQDQTWNAIRQKWF